MMKYTLERKAGLRWCVTCPDTSEFKTSSLAEALEFIRKHSDYSEELPKILEKPPLDRRRAPVAD